MGFFDAITRPIRGIGRILRGKFREGLGDIGHGAKAVAPVLAATTGIGALPAFLMGAGGGALEEGTKKNASFGDILKGAGTGAAWTGAGKLAAPVFQGGAGAAPNPFGAAQAGKSVSSIASGGGGLGSKLLGAGKGVASWVKDNPETALTIGGIGADAYGSYRQGQALDRQADLEESSLRRRWNREEAMDPVMQDLVRRILNSSSYN